MSLTDLQIKRLKAPETGQKTYFDDALPGFGVRVSQGGSKTFVVLYGKSRRRKSLGRYPDLSLSEARILAKQKQAELALAEGHPSAVKPDLAFIEARDHFLSDSKARTRPKTFDEYDRLLRRHFAFDKALPELGRTEIVEVLSKLGHVPSEQKHAFVALRTMLNWCVKRGLLAASPMPHLTFKVEARDRVLTLDELTQVWQRAEAFGYPYGRIVQLLILTGQRRGEITNLRASWIEEDKIVFPSSFTKNGREHAVPLGPRAQQVLHSLPEFGDLFFPARGYEDRAFNGFSKAKRALDETLEIVPYTLHDLRRTFASTLAALETPIHVTEKLLNHSAGTISGVAAIYNRHSYQAEMRAAIEAYEAHLFARFDS